MANLYEIDQKLQNAIEYGCDVETGEFIDEEGLKDLEMQLDKKIEGIGLYIKNTESDIDALKKEIETFKARLKTKENKLNGLKNYLGGYLLNNEIKKFETPKIVLGFRKSTTVNVYDESKVPSNFIIEKTEIKRSVDKKAVKDYLKTHKDEQIDGLVLEENQNLQIK